MPADFRGLSKILVRSVPCWRCGRMTIGTISHGMSNDPTCQEPKTEPIDEALHWKVRAAKATLHRTYDCGCYRSGRAIVCAQFARDAAAPRPRQIRLCVTAYAIARACNLLQDCSRLASDCHALHVCGGLRVEASHRLLWGNALYGSLPSS